MIVVLRPKISKAQENAVLKEIRKLGYRPHIIRGVTRTVIGAIGDERTHQSLETLITWPQVATCGFFVETPANAQNYDCRT